MPGANGHVPSAGPVTLSAVLVGRGADLASASLTVNGADAGAQIEKRSPRDWTIHASQTLAPGTLVTEIVDLEKLTQLSCECYRTLRDEAPQ